MKKLVIICLVFLFPSGFLFAQNFFILPNQTPMLINAGMAGSSKSMRANIAFNTFSNKPTIAYNNTYSSIDGYSNKLNLGLGIYYSLNNNASGQIHDSVSKYIATEKLPQSVLKTFQNQSIGICIARKLISPNQKYTLSPAIGVEYSWSENNLLNGFFANNGGIFSTETDKSYSFSYGSSSPYVFNKQSISKESISYLITNQNIQTYKISPGIVFNSKNLMVSYKFTFADNISNQELAVRNYVISNEKDTLFASKSNRNRSYNLSQLAYVGYNLELDKLSKQSITFLGGIGYNWNSYKSIESNNNLIYNPFYGLNKEGINYIHTSVRYKYMHWILGFAVTSQNNFTKNGLTLGFQNKKCRTFANIGLLNKKPVTEISLQYLLK